MVFFLFRSRTIFLKNKNNISVNFEVNLLKRFTSLRHHNEHFSFLITVIYKQISKFLKTSSPALLTFLGPEYLPINRLKGTTGSKERQTRRNDSCKLRLALHAKGSTKDGHFKTSVFSLGIETSLSITSQVLKNRLKFLLTT